MIHIDPNSSSYLYEQIYNHIKNEIKTGKLPRHTKLPSSRNLASDLQVSRNTIDMAYGQLVAEGYVESKEKSGYYVSSISTLMDITPKEKKIIKSDQIKTTDFKYDFSPLAVDINNFPLNIWKKLSRNCLNENNNDIFLMGDNQGDLPLRIAIARYLHESRGVNCDPSQIIVGAGADYLLVLLSQLLKRESFSIAMENPTYKQAYNIFKGMGFAIKGIKLDQDGIHLPSLYKENVDIVYVTPSHQYPLGMVMPISRRYDLLKWANENKNRYIIEDDHDSEFRYKGKPIPALYGIDSKDKVIYIGTFSRAIAPGIRVGYMVLPKRLLNIYKDHYNFYSCTVSRIDQTILTAFINEGYCERHLNRMRKHYKNKHDITIQTLKIFGDKIKIEGENAGLYLVLRFPSYMEEEKIIRLAKEHKIKIYGLKENYIKTFQYESGKNKIPPTILLGFANLLETDLRDGIMELYKGLKELF